MGAIKSKTITKLLDRFMDRGLEVWNDKEITTTLAAPGTVRSVVGRDISEIYYCILNSPLGHNIIKILANFASSDIIGLNI